MSQTISHPEASSSSIPTRKYDVKREDSTPEAPLYSLVQRILPGSYHDHFVFTLNPSLVPASSTNIYDTFRISNGNSTASDTGKIVVEGASIAGLGVGLNYYLRNVCHVEMSWSGDRFMDLPAVPPTINSTDSSTIRASFVPWRYYMNVVTFGYSYVFWDWKRWERELDWMLLNGVNMALAMVGQEYVFRQMYEDLGLTREDLNGFFAGPAYTPWQRMGNLQGSWGFPNDTSLKNDWIDSQWELQLQIMARMHELNITPIFPSFNGFVPRAMVQKFPTEKFENASDWGGFIGDPHARVTFISSSEPFFATMTQKFIKTQESLYQSNGLSTTSEKTYYLLDLFNELQPANMTSDYLSTATSGVMKALKSADPKAVWVMQSWFLQLKDIWGPRATKAYFDGIRQVDDGRDAFVIDLYADVMPLWNSTEGFFGIDWGWSMLNNFGGGQGLYGTLPTLLTEPFRGYHQPAKKMRGMGITMEGINNNEYLYQVVLDIPWESVEATSPSNITISPNTLSGQELKQPALNPKDHLESFIKRRYGLQHVSDVVLSSWTTLSQTVWDCRTGQMAQSKAYLDITPALDMVRKGFLTTEFWYDQTKVVKAWSGFVSSTETEESKKRRGHGPIQNAFAEVIRAASGKKNPDGKSTVHERFASASTQTFSEKIRDAFQATVGPWARGSVVLNHNTRDSTLDTPQHNETDPPLSLSSFRYDLVDVTREVMTAIVLPGLQLELVDAYYAKDLERTRSWGNLILDAISDTDRILSTHTHFMLGPWIRDARLSAKVVNSSETNSVDMEQYRNYLEHNARNQITWWGPVGQKGLADYASKEWGGLVSGFYYPRWKIFIDRLVSAVQNQQELDYKAYLADSVAVEATWINETSDDNNLTYPVEAVQDTVEVAQDLWDTWGRVALRLAEKAEKSKIKRSKRAFQWKGSH
ncbi:hypothetical protein BGZ76_011737 [Entomortierella beljakovae]|nr:hypothetical protein BGZ76_011737 [Entomortierella beljakovae]